MGGSLTLVDGDGDITTGVVDGGVGDTRIILLIRDGDPYHVAIRGVVLGFCIESGSGSQLSRAGVNVK